MPPVSLALNNTDDWPATSYGISTGASIAAAPTTTEINSLVTPSDSSTNAAKPWHPDSPLFAVGILIAVAFGLAGFSTSTNARIGKGKAGVDLHIGDSK
jgi:hypothetical protein